MSDVAREREAGATTDATAQLRLRKVAAAVRAWTGQLIDLGGRNTLLYYKDLKQGTLDLGPYSGAEPVALDALLGSRTVRLSEMFNPRGTATPAAPVLLRLANLAPRGGAGEDFDLSLPGEWEINPTLLHLLDVDHGVKVEAEDLLELLDEDVEPPDASAVFERLTKAASSVAGFAISDRFVLGNFSYAKLPMVKDLESATEALVQNELICAIAGDEAARDAVRSRHPAVSLDEPDHTPVADEFLVLDADASQSYVINAVVKGADLVVEGPPGTGKSQTIANLIATLAARGQRVLFVAEKRAAIDAVLDRLRHAGLADLVLDLGASWPKIFPTPSQRWAASQYRTPPSCRTSWFATETNSSSERPLFTTSDSLGDSASMRCSLGCSASDRGSEATSACVGTSWRRSMARQWHGPARIWKRSWAWVGWFSRWLISLFHANPAPRPAAPSPSQGGI